MKATIEINGVELEFEFTYRPAIPERRYRDGWTQAEPEEIIIHRIWDRGSLINTDIYELFAEYLQQCVEDMLVEEYHKQADEAKVERALARGEG